jgi:hypothetical protein
MLLISRGKELPGMVKDAAVKLHGLGGIGQHGELREIVRASKAGIHRKAAKLCATVEPS